VVAALSKKQGALTIGVVTMPFRFEGPLRMKQAIKGINALKNEVDALLLIHNEKLREIYGNLTLSNAFANADKVLMLAVKGIAEIITIHGYVNVDFADVHSVLTGGGIAFMGSATAGGSNRAKEVIDNAINSPLLNNNDIRGAGRVLLNITSGKEEITVDELVVITDTIIENVQGRVNTIWGTCTDESLGDEIRITLVATGFSEDSIPEFIEQNPPVKQTVELTDKKEGLLFGIEEKPENQNGESEVEEISSVNKLDEDPLTEFEVKDTFTDNDDQKEDDKTGLREELNTLEKINSARLKALNYNNLYDTDNIEQMEKIPAFKRKKEAVQPEIFPKEVSESRYTLGSKDNRLRANNSYLHDAVD
jgi:cell division protein FtsZ